MFDSIMIIGLLDLIKYFIVILRIRHLEVFIFFTRLFTSHAVNATLYFTPLSLPSHKVFDLILISLFTLIHEFTKCLVLLHHLEFRNLDLRLWWMEVHGVLIPIINVNHTTNCTTQLVSMASIITSSSLWFQRLWRVGVTIFRFQHQYRRWLLDWWGLTFIFGFIDVLFKYRSNSLCLWYNLVFSLRILNLIL